MEKFVEFLCMALTIIFFSLIALITVAMLDGGLCLILETSCSLTPLKTINLYVGIGFILLGIFLPLILLFLIFKDSVD